MDFPTFLSYLRQTSTLDWTFLDQDIPAIRAYDQGLALCPITAVTRLVSRKSYKNGNVYAAGERIGLSPDLVTLIMNAADRFDGHDSTMRRDLLTAVGLTEGSA